MDDVICLYDDLCGVAANVQDKIKNLNNFYDETDRDTKQIVKSLLSRVFVDTSNLLDLIEKLDECKNQREVKLFVDQFRLARKLATLN